MHLYSTSFTRNDELLKYVAMIRMIDRCIPREILIDPQSSQFEKMYCSGNNQTFITILGLTKKIFDELILLFEPIFLNYSPHNSDNHITMINNSLKYGGGRPRKINARSCLGLVLTYFRFTGAIYILQGWFGLTATSISVWFWFGLCIFNSILQNDENSKVEMPIDEQINVYKELLKKKTSFVT
jgi:hypothetical protein